MRKTIVTAVPFISCLKLAVACLGYSAFGQQTPVNILTKKGTVGFFNPDWLIDIANVCVVVRILGSYQMSMICYTLLLITEGWHDCVRKQVRL